MATESFRVSTVLPASAERLYAAWLDSREHSAFTGDAATVEPGIGGRFTAWDGYISGTTLELNPGRRIVQAWRTTQFSADDPDSRLEITFEPAEEGTRVILDHLDAPLGHGYEEGWVTHYFNPMQKYFGAATSTSAAATGTQDAGAKKPAKKVAAKKAAKKPAKKVAAKKGAKKPAKKVAAKKGAKKPAKKVAAKKGAKKPAKKVAAKKGAKKPAKKGAAKKGAKKPAKKGAAKKGAKKKARK